MKKPISKKLEVVKGMPWLSHNHVAGGEFDAGNSDVLKWLSSQPGVMAWVFDILRGRNLVIYDEETGMWRGVDVKSAPPVQIQASEPLR